MVDTSIHFLDMQCKELRQFTERKLSKVSFASMMEGMKRSFLAILLFAVQMAEARVFQRATLIHAPSMISAKEYARLYALGKTVLKGGSVLELPSGDLVINSSNFGVMVVSKDSELMGPVRLGRELFSLGKKYGVSVPIPFAELSNQGLRQFRKSQIIQYPQFDVNDKSCFSLFLNLNRSVRTEKAVLGEGLAPISTRTNQERAKRLETFKAKMDQVPLVIARKEEDARTYWDTVSLNFRESIFYDANDQRTDLAIERKALELFEGWSQFEVAKTQADIQQTFASGKEWENVLRGKFAKSSDDLKRLAPDEWEGLYNHITNDYDIYGFESADKARQALETAQVSYKFQFFLTVSLQGYKDLFNVDIDR